MSKRAAFKPGATLSPGLEDLLYQMLETELGGIDIYRTALRCVQNEELREEWTKYLEETEQHVVRVQDLCQEMGLDPETDTPGRQIVRTIGKTYVQVMNMAMGSDDPSAAERVAAECVVLAETKDHQNWSLLGDLVENMPKDRAAMADAHSDVEDEEDEHLYHSQGWARELWKQALGLPAQLPPPEEEHDVDTALEAAQVRGKPVRKE